MLQGSTNSILSEKGIEQIESQKQALRRSQIAIEMVFTSPTARAVQKAEILSKEKGVALAHNIKNLEENFSFDANGNFLKVPHGIIELKNNQFISYFSNAFAYFKSAADPITPICIFGI